MTSKELYSKLQPIKTDYETAQLTENGLSVNMSGTYTKLIKDAARCNDYSSDIFYDLTTINDALETFDPDVEFEPIWIGFRKLGVDGTSFVMCRIDNANPLMSLTKTYFALYSIDIVSEGGGFYCIEINEYAV